MQSYSKSLGIGSKLLFLLPQKSLTNYHNIVKIFGNKTIYIYLIAKEYANTENDA